MSDRIKTINFIGLIFMVLLPNITKGQITNDKERYQFTPKEWNIGLAYFGEYLLRPGFSLAVDYPIHIWAKAKSKKKGTKYRSLSVHLGARYWNYHQKVSHTGNAIDLEIFMRRTRAFDYKNRIGVFDFGISSGLGWNRLHGGVYETFETGFKKANRRQVFFSSGIFVSLGSNIKNTKNIPLLWYVKPKIIIETPYAPLSQFHPSLELGASIPLSYFKK